MIEIPDIYRKAWQEEMGLVSAQYAVPRTTLCDALVWALAQLMESEFRREHNYMSGSQCQFDYEYLDGRAVALGQCRDPRHFWTDAQWREAAVKKMEGGE